MGTLSQQGSPIFFCRNFSGKEVFQVAGTNAFFCMHELGYYLQMDEELRREAGQYCYKTQYWSKTKIMQIDSYDY